jgi:hypothetical protein
MHKERWFLFSGVAIPKDDAELDKTLAPIIAKTQ